ncbi:MAG: ethanolamine utilization protein EutJ [Synergistaceae bacterium]|jgi:ethanolamine utilization protein EutJ|nr:ethanolamine utilization protein EutJ [Synergistaceae bacterium]MBP9625993.1 ethanolamine utilization protein EutJ [Synergistaceae bacterium]MBP9957005.1 ethanolamine utilization protein EutJ [Synergistaceae bacterium]
MGLGIQNHNGIDVSLVSGVVIDQSRVDQLLAPLDFALTDENPKVPWEKLYLGFDLGTTNLVVVALNEKCEPVTAVLKSSHSAVRDGVVVDYFAALKGMEACVERMARRLGRPIKGIAAAAYPPGISEKTAKVFSTIVESLGFDCDGLYEEPTVAAETLGILNGAVVDIGGGTTGISILQGGDLVYCADEPTGGTHMTLVLAGGLNMEIEDAEELKRDKAEQLRLMPMLRPVLEKMGTIIKQHLKKSGYYGAVPIIVSGGGSDLPGAGEILSSVVGYPVQLAPYPMLVTPVGIAARLWREKNGSIR